MWRISLPLELRVVNLCLRLFKAGAGRGRSVMRAGFYLVGVGAEVLKFMAHAVLAFFHRVARAKTHAPNHLGTRILGA
jgi:hypothetical protein